MITMSMTCCKIHICRSKCRLLHIFLWCYSLPTPLPCQFGSWQWQRVPFCMKGALLHGLQDARAQQTTFQYHHSDHVATSSNLAILFAAGTQRMHTRRWARVESVAKESCTPSPSHHCVEHLLYIIHKSPIYKTLFSKCNSLWLICIQYLPNNTTLQQGTSSAIAPFRHPHSSASASASGPTRASDCIGSRLAPE
jgi:hypothetical protein